MHADAESMSTARQSCLRYGKSIYHKQSGPGDRSANAANLYGCVCSRFKARRFERTGFVWLVNGVRALDAGAGSDPLDQKSPIFKSAFVLRTCNQVDAANANDVTYTYALGRFFGMPSRKLGSLAAILLLL